MATCGIKYKEGSRRGERHDWIRRHTFTMFSEHGECLPGGPTGRLTPHTRIHGRVRGIKKARGRS